MKIEQRNIDDIIPNKYNTRVHGSTQIEEFKKSISKNGVLRPIVIDENNVILAGHGLFQALREIGKKKVDVLVKSGLSEKDKKKLLLSDNKIYSLGLDDYEMIDHILTELGEEHDFDVPGYDSESLEELYGIKSVEKDVENQSNVMQEQRWTSDSEIPNPQPDVPQRVLEQRAEVETRQYVICQNCGEKIMI